MSLAVELFDFASAVAADVKALFTRSLPSGGSTGQVLTKTSATNYATAWQTPSGGGGGITATKAYAQNLLRLS